MNTPPPPLPASDACTPAGQRPLDGLLVADFSRVLAGPLCTMTLADLGARVIKVERPGTGDDTRTWGPPFSATGATYFESVNRNKESVCLDFTDPQERAMAQELARRADVLVENFLPGTLDRLGLGYPELSGQNPGLIYASITGFGAAGGQHLPGYDFIIQALGGLMSITGDAEGAPLKSGVALVDVLTAKDATIAILAALAARRQTGRGSHVQVNLLSSLQGALANQGQAYLGAGVVPGRMGNEHPSICPYQLVQCADGPLAIACGNDRQFSRLTTELGIPAIAQDPRFATNTARVKHRNILIPLLERALALAPVAEWQERLIAAEVPAGRVAGIDESLDLAQHLGLEPTIDVHDETGHTVGRQVRHPATWNPPLATITAAPPRLGEHTDTVLAWLRETTDAPSPSSMVRAG